MNILRTLLMSFLMVLSFSVNSKETIRTDIGFVSPVEREAVITWVIKRTKDKASYNYAKKIVDTVYHYSNLRGIDPLMVLGMISKESMFRSNARNKSSASGLMQVIPYWHRDKIKKRNIFDVQVNIEVGTKIIADCLQNRKTTTGAMNCYSGGAKGYTQYVKERHKEIKQSIVLAMFENDQHINVGYSFNKLSYPQPQPNLIAGL